MIYISRKQRFLLSALSGVLMVLSFPYTGSMVPLTFVAWVPLLLIESYISKRKYKSPKVFTHAYLTFLIYNVGTTWWVCKADLVGGILAFTMNSLLMSFVFFLFHITKKYVGEKEGYFSLFFYWIAFEYLHHNWEMSWTWLTLGNAFSIVPSWVQWYEYFGVFGGSFWVLFVNLIIFRAFQNVLLKGENWTIQTPLFWSAAFFILSPILFSLWKYYNYEIKEEKKIEVVAIQPNIDPYNEKFNYDSLNDQVNKLIRLADSLTTEKTRLIVAPETAISRSFNEDEVYTLPEVKELLKAKKEKLNNVPWYLGASTYRVFESKNSRASRKQPDGSFVEFYNTSMFIDEEDHIEFIHKSKLVPGVEILPFSDIFPFLEELSIQNGGISGTLGVEPWPKIFQSQNFSFAPVVCYESVYGEWISLQCLQGANFIAIATNDGWWGDTPGYKQHASFASLRAIENRRDIVRSANTGISCFVNQRGDIIQATKWREEDVIRENISLNKEKTVYTRFGNILGRTFTFASVLLLFYTPIRWFRRKYIDKNMN